MEIIDSVHALDALPMWSVVLDSGGYAWQLCNINNAGEWLCVGSDDAIGPRDSDAPFKVIHRGETA